MSTIDFVILKLECWRNKLIININVKKNLYMYTGKNDEASKSFERHYAGLNKKNLKTVNWYSSLTHQGLRFALSQQHSMFQTFSGPALLLEGLLLLVIRVLALHKDIRWWGGGVLGRKEMLNFMRKPVNCFWMATLIPATAAVHLGNLNRLLYPGSVDLLDGVLSMTIKWNWTAELETARDRDKATCYHSRT